MYQIREIKEVILERESLFLMPGYEDAYNYYCIEAERRKQLKNNRKLVNWYSYYGGPSNLRVYLQNSTQKKYISYYSEYSKAAPGNDSFLGKKVSSREHSHEMVQLRSFTNLNSVFQYIFIFSTSILVTYLSTILPERFKELKLFRSWSR